MTGNGFTLADLHVASVASISHMLQYDLSPYPEVQRWLGEMQKRPAHQEYLKLIR